MDQLPPELEALIASDLYPREVTKLCRTNRRLRDICKQSSFWRQYLRTRFAVPNAFITKDPYIMAQRVQFLLDYAFSMNTFPSWRLAAYAATLESNNAIRAAVQSTLVDIPRQALLGVDDYNILEQAFGFSPEMWPLPPRVQFPEPDTTYGKLELRNDQKRYLARIIKYAKRPTIYYTPQGDKRLPIDIDILLYLNSLLFDNYYYEIVNYIASAMYFILLPEMYV